MGANLVGRIVLGINPVWPVYGARGLAGMLDEREWLCPGPMDNNLGRNLLPRITIGLFLGNAGITSF